MPAASKAVNNAAKKAQEMTFKEAWDASSEHVVADTLKGLAGGLTLNAVANVASDDEGGYMGAAILGAGVGGIARSSSKYLGLDTQVSKLFSSAKDSLKTSTFSDAVSTKGKNSQDYRTITDGWNKAVSDPKRYRDKQGELLAEAQKQLDMGNNSIASDLQHEARSFGNSAEKWEMINYNQKNSLKMDQLKFDGMSEKEASRKVYQDLFDGSEEERSLLKKYNRKEFDALSPPPSPSYAPKGSNVPKGMNDSIFTYVPESGSTPTFQSSAPSTFGPNNKQLVSFQNRVPVMPAPKKNNNYNFSDQYRNRTYAPLNMGNHHFSNSIGEIPNVINNKLPF